METSDDGFERPGAAAGRATGASRPGEANKTGASNARARDPKLGQGSLYRQYVGNLYRVVCDTLRTNRNRQVGQSAVLDALGELAGMEFVDQGALLDNSGRERTRCLVIRDAIRKFLNRAPSSSFPYAPEEEEEVNWRQFWPRYPDIVTRAGGQQIVFDQVRKMGHLWRA